jgi:hypothetical protein
MVSKVTYKLKLNELIDTSDLTAAQKDEIKERVGEALYDLVLQDASNQMSSVTGRKWKSLSKDYKEYKSEVADPIANLELTGDMLDALEYLPYRDGIEFGFFDFDQAQKADNHNKFSAASKKTPLPPRRSIPKKDESFRAGILKELIEIAEDIKSEIQDQ